MVVSSPTQEELLGMLGVDSAQEELGGICGDPEPKKKGKDAEPEPFFQINQAGPNPYFGESPKGFEPEPGFLKHDAQDEYIPRNSFIGDFVYSLKGYESPVIFNIWGAIFALSVMSGRQSFFKFGSSILFPNMYVIWVAKPGVCKKGTALGLASDLIQELPDQFPDDTYMREERSMDYISSKAPADAIFMSLKPKNRTFILPDGSVHQASFGSRTYVAATELATFLNTKKFNTGMVDTLTDLYDCKERDRELTRGRGVESFEKFFFCLGGACTPMHMETSFPPEARGGGFMSRCILVHQEFPTVWHPVPVEYPGFPRKQDLLDQLRHLAYTTRGGYYLTEEANAEYERWYMDWRHSLFTRGVQDDALAETRQDILTLKLATLIRMGEYRKGHDITLENYRLARHLLSFTLANSNLVSSGLGAKEKRINYIKVRSMLQTHTPITRNKLLPKCSSKSIFVQELAGILSQLVQEGLLKIELDGFQRYVSGSEGREIYTWIGPSRDDERIIEQKAVESIGGRNA